MAERLEKMLADGPDSPTLRFGLGNAWLASDAARAATHLEAAVSQDPEYSAAWKLLGRARAALGEAAAAIAAYEQGIAAAERRGDVQAAKEMRVFLKRLRKAADGGA
ncbi:MAG: hypothetical protein H6977_04715 [Gammaproteobacteria bacterium]|nr:hypothetical protein [Gammaproteobacteria bacterium]MCP5199289.1 hypothetical protein [Gammaproteobacteria bacterium]